MIVPPTESLRLIRSAREFPRRASVWADAFRSVDWDKAECLSEKPGSAVWRVDLPLPDGVHRVVIKVKTHASPVDAVRSVLHGGRLRRHWRGAARLSRHGFRVARCRALLWGVAEHRVSDVLVMEHVEGTPLIELLADRTLSTHREHTLADHLGELISRLDGHRLHSKDFKPSNILVGFPDELEGAPAITIIDSDTVGRRPAHPLLPLAIEPIGLGVLPRRSLLARVIKAWAFSEWVHHPIELPSHERITEHERVLARIAWREIEQLIERHGDPTPKHNPLDHARALAEQGDRAEDGAGDDVALRAASG